MSTRLYSIECLCYDPQRSYGSNPYVRTLFLARGKHEMANYFSVPSWDQIPGTRLAAAGIVSVVAILDWFNFYSVGSRTKDDSEAVGHFLCSSGARLVFYHPICREEYEVTARNLVIRIRGKLTQGAYLPELGESIAQLGGPASTSRFLE